MLINKPAVISSLEDVEGPKTFIELSTLVTFPRLVYSFSVALGLFYLFKSYANKVVASKKAIFLVAVVVIFFIVVFPWKILAMRNGCTLETKRGVFSYQQGGIGGGIGPSWDHDRANLHCFGGDKR